ncbi:hypothetical protein YQE_00240, partial [Dendroctonus ponderosae]
SIQSQFHHPLLPLKSGAEIGPPQHLSGTVAQQKPHFLPRSGQHHPHNAVALDPHHPVPGQLRLLRPLQLPLDVPGEDQRRLQPELEQHGQGLHCYLLLSIETMTTVGYGYRYPTEHCVGGWVLLMLQAIFNTCVQGALVSAVYVKTSKPFTKSSSLFSKKAVVRTVRLGRKLLNVNDILEVCLRDGKLCFIFRIHDFSRKIWCGTNISLYYIDKEQNHLDEDFEMQKMTIEPHGLLLFPLEIEHVIDEDSPLYKFRPFEVLHTRYEIVAVAEGSSTITGQVSQNRTSYSNADIMWGHRFLPCVDYDERQRIHVVDYKKFKQVLPFDTPLCSARKLAEMQS